LDKNKPLVLFERGAGSHNYVAQSGLLGAGLPNHNSPFVAEQDQYVLSGNAEQVQVRLKAESDSALKVTKLMTFHKGSYLVDVAYELENTGQQRQRQAAIFN
jgi:YidC/Oxa1 family membrane protein insertase